MRYLILSDIHANWQGLEGVLAAAAGRYDEIVCLGDIVGYGADPNRTTEWVRKNCSTVIRGNHDKACSGLENAEQFNPVAKQAVEWTHHALSDENREYLRALPGGPIEVNGFAMVHGSVRDEDEYVLDARDAAPQFEHVTKALTFFGHTHVQGGFFLRAANSASDDAVGAPGTFHLRDNDLCLVNPGSVGQPRDYQWEAGFAVYDSQERTVSYGRCPYDVQAAQTRIRAAGLPASLAERLALGR